MTRFLIFLFFLLSQSAIANCEKYYLFNNEPRILLESLDNSTPGYFEKVTNKTNDGFFYFDGFRRVDETQKLGEILYKYFKKSDTLFISNLHVEIKGARIGSVLLAKVLSEFPYVSKVKTVLGLDNFNAFMLAREMGLSDIDALKMTPAYKMRKKMGFRTINRKSIDIDLEESSISFTVEK